MFLTSSLKHKTFYRTVLIILSYLLAIIKFTCQTSRNTCVNRDTHLTKKIASTPEQLDKSRSESV